MFLRVLTVYYDYIEQHDELAETQPITVVDTLFEGNAALSVLCAASESGGSGAAGMGGAAAVIGVQV